MAEEELAPGLVRVQMQCTIPASHRHPGWLFRVHIAADAWWNAAKHDIEKKLRGQEHVRFLSTRAALAERLREERAAGVPCTQLAAKYNMSVHMVRYYTRISRSAYKAQQPRVQR